MNDDRERVRDANPIADVIQEYFPLLPDGHKFKALCPFHREKTPSFKVDPERGSYHCFGCDERGDIFTFVMRLDNLEFRDALQQLANRAGIRLERRGGPTSEEYDLRKRDLSLLDRAATWFQNQLAAPQGAGAREYLEERGFTTDAIARFRIGYSPPSWQTLAEVLNPLGLESVARAKTMGLLREAKSGRTYDGYRNRVIFPIRTAQGYVVGFGGRILEGAESSDETTSDGAASSERKEPKYINSPESPLFRKGELLYGHFEGRETLRRTRTMLLMEGYTDVMMAHQAGFEGAVATLGTALAEPNVDTVSRHCERLVLVFDGDEAGRRAAVKAVRLLLPQSLDVSVAVLPAGVDPCDLIRRSPDEFSTAIEQAKEALAFVVDEAIRTHGLSSESPGPAKEQVARHCFEYLHLMDSAIRVQEGLRVIARRIGVGDSILNREFGRARPPAPARQVHSHEPPPRAPSRRIAGDEEWILLGALASAEWAQLLLQLHPPASFAEPVLNRLANQLVKQDGVLTPLDVEDPGEKSKLLGLTERLEDNGFDEERATHLLRDLLVRWLESCYERVTARRGATAWGGPNTGSPTVADAPSISSGGVTSTTERTSNEPRVAARSTADAVEALTRRQLEIRTEIARLKGTQKGDWRTLSETAERWLSNTESYDQSASAEVVTPAGERHS